MTGEKKQRRKSLVRMCRKDSKPKWENKANRKGRMEENRNSCQEPGVEAKSCHPSAINKYLENAAVENVHISSQLGTKKKYELTTTSRYTDSSGAEAEQERQQFRSHMSACCHRELPPTPPAPFFKSKITQR